MVYDKFFSAINPRVEYKGTNHQTYKMNFLIQAFDPDDMAMKNSFNHSRSSSEYGTNLHFFTDANDQLCYLYFRAFVSSDECSKVLKKYQFTFIEHDTTVAIIEEINQALLNWIDSQYKSLYELRHLCATRLVDYYTSGIDFYRKLSSV